MKLRCRGIPYKPEAGPQLLARATRHDLDPALRADSFRIVDSGAEIPEDATGYAALLVADTHTLNELTGIKYRLVHGYGDLSGVDEGDVLSLQPSTGEILTLYRPSSSFNGIFATGQCNSNCIMCPQPPSQQNDLDRLPELLRLVDLIPNQPSFICISGGEPLLLKNGIVTLLSHLCVRLSTTSVHMLTNGRLLAYEDLTRAIGDVHHPDLRLGIPLYASTADQHDYIVQAKGAFDQTLAGLYNCARHGIPVEIRVVLHKQTIPLLQPLMEFIYRNLPFVEHVALMGLEHMGYVKKNWEMLWIDPFDYQDELERALHFLHMRRIPASVYNLPLCVLPRPIWSFARQSISDFKNIYLNECATCTVREQCSGLFASQEVRHSTHIHPITLETV